MKLAPEGRTIILISGSITLGLWLSVGITGYSLEIAAIISTLLFGFVLYFFRDPRRVCPEDRDAVVSAGDGTVVAIEPVEWVEYLDGPGIQISVFLTVFNVHVNRIPVPGVVEMKIHRPGKFLAAMNHRASLENEQAVLGIRNGNRKVLVRQIAGLIARRIVCHVTEGESVAHGQRFGIIKFGSRMDIVVPPQVNVQVRIGQRVRGGETVIGRFPHDE